MVAIDIDILLVNVYTPCQTHEQADLWVNLSALLNGCPCGKVIAGNFNAVRHRGERSGSLKMATDFAVKLKKLKSKLKSWNQNSCENFDVCIRKLVNRIDELEEVRQEGHAGLNVDDELKDCKMKLWDTLKLQEDLWRQKARVNWLSQVEI
ncbi:hypothetical protein V6N13_114819 [Hibiscus sabdariffa]